MPIPICFCFWSAGWPNHTSFQKYHLIFLCSFMVYVHISSFLITIIVPISFYRSIPVYLQIFSNLGTTWLTVFFKIIFCEGQQCFFQILCFIFSNCNRYTLGVPSFCHKLVCYFAPLPTSQQPCVISTYKKDSHWYQCSLLTSNSSLSWRPTCIWANCTVLYLVFL